MSSSSNSDDSVLKDPPSPPTVEVEVSTPNTSAADTSDLDDGEGIDPAPPTTGMTDEAKKAAKKAERWAEKERLINWAKGLKLTDVVLTKEGDDVETLGVRKWTDLKVYVMTAFINASKIPIAQELRQGKDLGKNVANEINCTGYKQNVKASRNKKKGGTAKPVCIKSDGTLYRAINVMMRKKEQVTIIKEAHDRDDQDSRKPKAVAFGILYAEYCSFDGDLKKTLRPVAMLLWGIPSKNLF